MSANSSYAPLRLLKAPPCLTVRPSRATTTPTGRPSKSGSESTNEGRRGGWGEQRPFVTDLRANFVETRICELRLVPSPMGENFSGSRTVTSRNPLIHIDTTTATKSPRFGAGGRHSDLAIKCATHSGRNVGRKIWDRVCPRPIPLGFHAFHKPDFPPSQIRLCVAGFMARFGH